MVAKVESGKSLRGALNYNEQKVKAGKAELLEVRGYAKDLNLLLFEDKLSRLTDLAERNQRTKTNTVHISLNFHVKEKLDNDKVVQISDGYMARIGFGNQPYLIYRHHDAGHPHVHIVSTNIQANGERISLHNIGRLRSEPARRAVETKFDLVRADAIKQEASEIDGPKPLRYGETELKRAIGNIVNHVTRSYKFTSLYELNAVLQGFNVVADRGTANSTMFRKNGLRYWATDDAGVKIGVPIKASSIFQRPTLKLLEDRFRLNEHLRKPFKDQLQMKIDRAISLSHTLNDFRKQLEKENIDMVCRTNKEGRLYGITYVDKERRVVFNGSDIGKRYSAVHIISAFQSKQEIGQYSQSLFRTSVQGEFANSVAPANTVKRNLLDDLMDPVEITPGIPTDLRRKRKKKRKGLNH